MGESERLEELVSHSVREFAVARERIDAELKAERARRMDEAKTALALVLARAYAQGLKISRIKELYGTRDHRTVRALIDHGTVLLARLGGEARPESEGAGWTFEVHGDMLIVDVGTPGDCYTFQLVDLGDSIMLATDAPLYPDGPEGDKDPVVAALDGLTIYGTPDAITDDQIIAAAERALSL